MKRAVPGALWLPDRQSSPQAYHARVHNPGTEDEKPREG